MFSSPVVLMGKYLERPDPLLAFSLASCINFLLINYKKCVYLQVTLRFSNFSWNVQAQSSFCFISETAVAYQTGIKTKSDGNHQKCIILSCSHEAFSNGALGRVINLTSWPYIEFQLHKNHLEKAAWDVDRRGLRKQGLFFVLYSLLCLFLPRVIWSYAILTELWHLSLADNDVFFRISRVCYILLSYFRPNIICMWCQGAADAVSVLIVSRWRCIPASCAGSKLSQREESGGDSSRAKYRDPALLQPLSYFLFSVFLFLSLTKILQKYPGVMVF